MEKTLVVVHPGSTCGSADFNLGYMDSGKARERLAQTIRQWEGPLIVIDGDLSDELEHYATPALFIENHSAKNKVSRFHACAQSQDDWVERATAFIQSQVPEASEVKLTGAWTQEDDRQGCIDAVDEALRAKGYITDILPCALRL